MMFNFFQCVCINLAKIVKGERNTKSSLFEFCFPSRLLSWSFSSKITINEREIRSLLLYLSLRVQKIFDLSKMVKERNTKKSRFVYEPGFLMNIGELFSNCSSAQVKLESTILVGIGHTPICHLHYKTLNWECDAEV